METKTHWIKQSKCLISLDSQTHRIIQVGSHWWRSPTPTSCSVEAQLELAAQCWLNFWCPQGWMFNNLSKQLIPIFDHCHSKISFPCIKQKSPKFYIGCFLSSCAPRADAHRHLWVPEAGPGSLFKVPFHYALSDSSKISLSHLFTWLNKPSPQCLLLRLLTVLVACPLPCSSLSKPFLLCEAWNHNHKQDIGKRNNPLKNNETSSGTLGSLITTFFGLISGHISLSTKIVTG